MKDIQLFSAQNWGFFRYISSYFHESKRFFRWIWKALFPWLTARTKNWKIVELWAISDNFGKSCKISGKKWENLRKTWSGDRRISENLGKNRNILKKTGEFREKWENLRENLRKTSNGDERIWENLRKNWKILIQTGKLLKKTENLRKNWKILKQNWKIWKKSKNLVRNEKKPQMKPENFEEKSEKIFGKKKKKKGPEKWGKNIQK